MKPASAAFLQLINNQAQFAIAELYNVTLRNGTIVYFTDLDIPLTLSGITYVANSLRFEGLKFKLSIGFEVDEQELRISAFPGETLAGSSFFTAVGQGLLDGGTIARARAFWPATSGPAYNDYAPAPIAIIPIFTGRVSTITKIGRTHVEMKLKSPMSFLDVDMPRNTYEPGCQWRLFDSGCTLNQASFTTAFTVNVATATIITPTIAIPTVTGADGVNNYVQGKMLFTSGTNNNFQTTIANNDSSSFYLQYPLFNIPAPGDTFNAIVGCTKTLNTCTAKFSNQVNFRGFPRVPPIVVSV